MGGVISRPKPPPAPTPPPVSIQPMPIDAPITPTKAEMPSDMGNTRGRSSTILTGARGLGDNQLTTSKRRLLGG